MTDPTQSPQSTPSPVGAEAIVGYDPLTEAASYDNLVTVDRDRLAALHEIFLLAKSWELVWGDKLSPESLESFHKHEAAVLNAAAPKPTAT
jgi:hypothetical protein